MKGLFDQVSAGTSALTTRTYSTSFSLGISFLHSSIRNHINAIYGFVRFADEIVDSFDEFDKKYLLEKYKKDTFEAIDFQISLNPILNNFQQTVHTFGIPFSEIDIFFKSMEMDLIKKQYNRFNYEQYIFGSAEVVGLMCLRVFAEGSNTLFQQLKPFAMKLGSAFQKVNFLRDMKEDYHTLGRLYFPNICWEHFNHDTKQEIEKEIEEEFKEALKGIRLLPSNAKGGVYLAYVYYYSLFKKIKKLPPQRILSERIRINQPKKIQLMCNSIVQRKMNLI